MSAEGRWLASVGDVHDGFIFLWSLGARFNAPKLLGSNKCIATVNAMAWMGKSVVTVGVRHVKVWRPDLAQVPSPTKSKFKPKFKDDGSASPASKALNGRNVILGSLLEYNFTCVASVSDTLAVIGTDNGDICLLDDTAASQRLIPYFKETSAITCVSVDREKQELWYGCASGRQKRVLVSSLDIRTVTPTERTSERQNSISKSMSATTAILGIGLLGDSLVTVSADRSIRISQSIRSGDATLSEAKSEVPSHQGSVMSPLAASVPEISGGSFVTYDSAGDMMIWTRDGDLQERRRVPLEQIPSDGEVEANELKVLKFNSTGEFLVAGDKYGILRYNK